MMTREAAILALKEVQMLYTRLGSTNWEALKMAIDALELIEMAYREKHSDS
jgi:hypothetical protein